MRIHSLSGPKKLALSVLAAAMTAAGAASAVFIAPGTGATPVGWSTVTDPTLAGTIIASQTIPFDCSSETAMISGTLDNYVVRNTRGTLDFYYKVTSASSSTEWIREVQSADFSVSTVDADYRTDLPGTSRVVFVRRSAAPGGWVEWIFDPPVFPGTASVSFYSRSTRTTFAVGKTEIIGGQGVICYIGGTYMPS